jgi:hypothetical protein
VSVLGDYNTDLSESVELWFCPRQRARANDR